ncbi:MAG: DNA-binding transcriptional MerR regulator [Pseudoalteromonas tetraodonis]|jgi:DNA-binding transcriptional MerR regulator
MANCQRPVSYDLTMSTSLPLPRRRGKNNNNIGEYEYTVDDLARLSHTTVRNIRAYQDRGVLPPPEKRGRLGIYSNKHLARMRVINSLLDRGFTLNNINELIAAWEDGRDLNDVLGLEAAITSPFSDEVPQRYTMTQLLKLFGLKAISPEFISKATELDILQRDGTGILVKSPRLIEAAAEMIKIGIDLVDLVDILRMMRGNVTRVADALVELAAGQLDQFGNGQLPGDEELRQLSELIWRLRPLAHIAIQSEAERALERSANKFLGDRMANILEHLPPKENT